MAGIFHKHAQFHITPQRVIRIMHFSLTLRHIPAPAVRTRTLAEGVHRGGSLAIRTTRHTCAALIIQCLQDLTIFLRKGKPTVTYFINL